ncbi:hypothetical protein NLJ89_g11931 [Agrocybe chaxingu]|uniref:Dethiobiotin synthase n=1 Tax=Agrocybe chaxingu TaxID=84603 RepID=A0A9W8JNF5_9AGAR|nr:hypothetical protein NLJ89_g11931 [Agrocybe chaxingu]
MTSLFRHLRVHQVFGANTDVGKTILTTALVRASAKRGKDVFYLKPVSTGALEDADDHHVKRYTNEFLGKVHPECLFRYDEPVSPHLAAKMKEGESEEGSIPTDETFITSIADRIRYYAKKSNGPSHIPTLSGTTQADAYRPLFLPTVLIGDSKLGGISTTITAYESLLLRGYIIDAVLLFQDEYYRNGEYLKPYFEERGAFLAIVRPPPPRLSNSTENFISTEGYYKTITSAEEGDEAGLVVDHLDVRHKARIEELESMPRRTLDTVWWPFVQHGQRHEEV